jgi:hypothetical protein
LLPRLERCRIVRVYIKYGADERSEGLK